MKSDKLLQPPDATGERVDPSTVDEARDARRLQLIMDMTESDLQCGRCIFFYTGQSDDSIAEVGRLARGSQMLTDSVAFMAGKIEREEWETGAHLELDLAKKAGLK